MISYDIPLIFCSHTHPSYYPVLFPFCWLPSSLLPTLPLLSYLCILLDLTYESKHGIFVKEKVKWLIKPRRR